MFELGEFLNWDYFDLRKILRTQRIKYYKIKIRLCSYSMKHRQELHQNEANQKIAEVDLRVDNNRRRNDLENQEERKSNIRFESPRLKHD